MFFKGLLDINGSVMGIFVSYADRYAAAPFWGE
jgi:hypothetical protein